MTRAAVKGQREKQSSAATSSFNIHQANRRLLFAVQAPAALLTYKIVCTNSANSAPIWYILDADLRHPKKEGDLYANLDRFCSAAIQRHRGKSFIRAGNHGHHPRDRQRFHG